MLFNSLQFFLFFPAVVVGYFLIPRRMHWLFLLLVSCYFYMAFIPQYILILAAVIIIDYCAGIFIENAPAQRKKIFLLLSIFSNVAILFVFKYFNFFTENLTALAQFLHWNYSIHGLSLILPIGLSFHTFQSLSYIIEVYRGNQKAERHFGIYALYVMFFPQLVAGPIERPQNLLHQFHEEKQIEPSRVVSGLRLMLYGFFKKIVIADNIAQVVNFVFGHAKDSAGWPLLVAIVLFAFQIYCDFSGYSDVARGAARVLGFDLMKNFHTPYFAKSINEFWKRWHISLSSWFRDYVYIPLGGNKSGQWKHYRNLFFTFLLSGLWHGANWTYVVWGGLNAVYLIFSQLTKNLRFTLTQFFHLNQWPRVWGFIQTITTFTLVTVSWIFFRASSLREAYFIITHMFDGFFKIFQYDYLRYHLLVEGGVGIDKKHFTIILISIFILLSIEYFMKSVKHIKIFLASPRLVRWACYYAVIFYIILYGFWGHEPFIYFQF